MHNNSFPVGNSSAALIAAENPPFEIRIEIQFTFFHLFNALVKSACSLVFVVVILVIKVISILIANPFVLCVSGAFFMGFLLWD